MALVATLEGELALWGQILSINSIGYPVLHLFNQPHTPLHTDTAATYAAIEGGPPGYGPVALTQPAANWTFQDWPVPPPFTAVLATYQPITWQFTGAGTIYGYFVTAEGSNVALWGEALGPFIFTALGGTFTLQLMPWLASQPSAQGVPCITP